MTEITEHKFENRDQLINRLTDDVLQGLNAGLEQRGTASMLLSGGTTPGPLYEKLSQQELDWKNVHFAPTDERWVDPDHDESNEKLIRATLLQNKAAGAQYIGLKSSPPDPVSGQVETEAKLAALPMPLDIVLLGMGEDGHVASLFPGLADTKAAMSDTDQLCHAVRRGGDDTPRMSMTLNALLQTKRIFLLFYGVKKLEIFDRAKQGKTDNLPVSFLLNQDAVPVSLYWADQ